MSRSRANMQPMVDPPESGATLVPGAQVGGYVVDRRIGVGGFGEVFRARQPVIGRDVAIKVLHAKYSADPDSVARFVAEARAVNQISHAGIVEIFDFGRLEDGREFCVMELLDGHTLREVLRERGRLSLAEAIPILRGIAEAVDAAHAAGIAHRDLKPDNVFVLADGRTKLIDFGLAKLMHERDSPITQTGSIFGTPMYMSPEQCRGGALDTRTDLYSFGVLAYHLLTGEPPFAGDPIEVALHHVNDRPEPPSKRVDGGLPRYVDHVVLSLLAKDPVDRPASLGTAVSALEGSITLRRMRSRHVRQLVATAVIVAALAGGAVAWKRHRDASSDCTPASQRLQSVWTPAIRDAIGKRFVASDRPDAAATWRAASRANDDFVAKWSAQWDDACHATDRGTDPLLYAQRLTCLENLFVELRGRARLLANVDIGTYARVVGGSLPMYSRSVEDCANPAVLRAQVPAPPPGDRDRVAMLTLDSFGAITDAYDGAIARDTRVFDAAIARLDKIIAQLEVIHPPAAAMPILLRTDVVVVVSWDVASRLPRAREALARATREIETTRDDFMIAGVYLLAAGFALDDERDGDSLARASEALDRAEQAIARAGHPKRVANMLAVRRAQLAYRRGEVEASLAGFRDSFAAIDPSDMNGVMYSFALAEAGHDRDALTSARAWSAKFLAASGGSQGAAANAHLESAMILHRAGDLAGALAEQRLGRAARAQLGGPAYWDAWGQIYEVDLEIQLGRAKDGDVVAAIHALAGRGTTPPRQSPDGLATARRAGHWAAFTRGAELELAGGSDEALDAAAFVAFARGDVATMTKHASVIALRCAKASCADWIRTSRWLALLATPRVDLDAQLAALEREYGSDRVAVANSGVVLASLGRWQDARTKLETARALPDVWERHSDLMETDTWLGLARLRLGDRAGARASLEEALDVLSIWHNGFAGFTYMTPVAELTLAELLPETDRGRARVLAGRARNGFTRLGKDRDRDRAIGWLAAH